MSAAGTPSSDPWVIVSRERSRYEEQFKSLSPLNGIITGEQAKGFFLQSKLPPIILGQIWGLADINADGKMDINEFSIACKLINLKLRNFDIPQVLPPTLIASLRMYNAQLPAAASALPSLINTQPIMSINEQPISNTHMLSNFNSVPPTTSLQNFVQPQVTGSFAPTLISGIPPPMSSMPSNVSLLSGNAIPPNIPVIPSNAVPMIPNSIGLPIVPPAEILSSLSQVPISISSSIVSNTSGMPIIPSTGVPVLPPLIPSIPSIPSAPGSVGSATSTPRASIGSLDRLDQ